MAPETHLRLSDVISPPFLRCWKGYAGFHLKVESYVEAGSDPQMICSFLLNLKI